MAKKLMSWKTKGMNKDLSVSAFNPEFSFENRNLRLSTNDGNTLLSWVNEKGTTKLKLNITYIHPEYWSKEGYDDVYTDPHDESWTHHDAYQDTTDSISGTPVGSAVLNHYLVLFTTEEVTQNSNTCSYDRIYKLRYTDSEMEGVLLYPSNVVPVDYDDAKEKSLNLSVENPLETLVSYESESIQKVYWTDGRNQPRVINIVAEGLGDKPNTYFDFVPTLQLNETVTVKKLIGASGMFAPGVIQYAFTYYNKYGQESNIFYTTPLHYISHADRGASPEEKVDNAFKITVTGVDTNFDFLRIYSIQRTSLNGTPICKRVQDIDIQNLDGGVTSVSYTDTGTSGDSIDPTELLYKGGESIKAFTMEQKDGTLFMGNFGVTREQISTSKNSIQSALTIYSSTRNFYPTEISGSSSNYPYWNQLTSYPQVNSSKDTTQNVPCSGFKRGDYYRLGVQFQYKNGKWSDPVEKFYISGIITKDFEQTNYPEFDADNTEVVSIPVFSGSLTAAMCNTLYDLGYRKVRPVVVFPSPQDRMTLCQAVAAPTLYTTKERNAGNLHAQSSWFFRPYSNTVEERTDTAIEPTGASSGSDPYLMYASQGGGPTDLQGTNILYRKVEIQGHFSEANKFRVDDIFLTLHSPDIVFDESILATDFNSIGSYKWVGDVEFKKTLSDINIQTETPTISNLGGGFDHQTSVHDGISGIVSGLYYDDFAIDDVGKELDPTGFQKFGAEQSAYKWLVYLWNKGGSLNNDVTRPSGAGTASAILKKKIISNLRYANSEYSNGGTINSFTVKPQLFSGDEVSIVKLNWEDWGTSRTGIYQGNIDTVLIPDEADGQYFAFGSHDTTSKATDSGQTTTFSSEIWWKTWSETPDAPTESGPRKWGYDNIPRKWVDDGTHTIGTKYVDLVMKKEGVRMKYKSSAHLVGGISFTPSYWGGSHKHKLPIIDVLRASAYSDTIFGGQSKDALKENVWVPCGEPVRLDSTPTTIYVKNGKVVSSSTGGATSVTGIVFNYSYGDTYFQRWDCLKTYAFTPEDINQVVEIGSFMLETHVNIDGRYDRNRGQLNNLNMSPRNFNLLNPVYSQIDNFFSYKIQDDDYYKHTSYPNHITWSKTKESGMVTDPWTNVTLASVLEMDGDKGEVRALRKLNNQLLCFQDSGISQILYNERTQLSTTQGVPVEVASSGLVDGKNYLSNAIGCSNKWSMASTPSGIYFMDSNEKAIFLFNGELQNLSQKFGMNSWCKSEIPSSKVQWHPNFDNDAFMACYDRQNQDVLWVNNDIALAFSERVGAFTSFYDYGGTPFFCNLEDTGVWIRNPYTQDNSLVNCGLWKHQGGNYGRFFGENKPYWMTLVGNPEPQTDKIFTNMEFRACVDGDGVVTQLQQTERFNPLLPFDSLETWDEYQHGIAQLDTRNGHAAFKHHADSNTGEGASIKRKFRIWRCDIPRDNFTFLTIPVLPENPTEEQQSEYQTLLNTYNDWLKEETEKGISRHSRHPIDRMRNPWLYLKLMKEAEEDDTTSEPVVERSIPKVEVHDLVMTYYN